MIKLNDVETFFSIYHVKQVSQTNWKLGDIEIIFSKGILIMTGTFPYSLVKEICSKPSYGKNFFLSKEKENLPFEYFLTNAFVEKSLSFLSSGSYLSCSYEEYSKKYYTHKMDIIIKCISDGKENELFVSEIVITELSPLREILISIIDYLISPQTSIS